MKRTTPLSVVTLLLLLNFAACSSFAQSAAPEPAPQPPNPVPTVAETPSKLPALNVGLLGTTFSDTGKILTAPARWGRSDWTKAGIVAGATLGIYALDSHIRDWAQNHRSSTTDSIANFARPFGVEAYTLPAMGALYFAGEHFKDDRLRDTASLGIESMLVSGLFTEGLKHVAHRVRPDDTTSPGDWNGPSLSGYGDSFPSGHSSSAFALATVIASQYSDKKYVPPLAYGIATLTALSRVNDNVHWASDVFAGSALGYFTAKAILRLHPGLNSKDTTITPVIGGGQMGVKVSHEF